MNTINNKISVIVTCYNQEEFLLETCNSLINQTYNNWEAIIVNDGSTDDTEKIALKVCKDDSRFRYYYKKNAGVSSARNYGLKKCYGDFIQFLDGDDKLENSKFELSINEVNKDKNLEVIVTNFLRFKSKNGKPKKDHFNLNDYQINYKNILLSWDIEFTIPIHSGLFSVKSMEGILFNESLKAKEDWVFWIQLFKKNPKVFFLNKRLALYRAHKKNMSKNNDKMFLNGKNANEIIYESLDEAYKNVFFKRLNDELLMSKTTYHDFKDKLLSRRIISSLKKLF